MTWPFAGLWDRALNFETFVSRAANGGELWAGVYRLAQVPLWAVEEAAACGPLRIVVLAEDWCGDAVNTVPVLAKWAALTRNVELRILRRDEHPEVMDRYLTGFSRSIPVVIVLTDDFQELGWWGPRPRVLQARVLDERARGRDKSEIYADARRWYARDRGESTLREVLEVAARVLEGARR